MIDFLPTISQFIESQFPRYYREQEGVELTQSDREVMVAFLEAYYEFIEENYQDNFLHNRMMVSNRDIDTTLDDFILYFREKYMKDISYIPYTTDQRFLIKHIFDLYRAKGSETAIKLLFKLLFNEEATVYIPGKDILRASDSVWFEPVYLEVESANIVKTLLNKRIVGSISKAQAFVEGVITKRIAGRLIDVIYISNVQGTFVYNDLLTADGSLAGAPRVLGSLTGVTFTDNTVGGFSVGDLVEIESTYGRKGIGLVRSVLSTTDSVSFTIVDGGFGFTKDDYTSFYISDTIVEIPNDPVIFNLEDTITQHLEKVYLEPDQDFRSLVFVGDTITGQYAGNTYANGVILEKGTESILGVTYEYITIQSDATTLFRPNQRLTLDSNTTFFDAETIQEESSIILTVSGASGAFSNGETVYAKEYYTAANQVSQSFAIGVIYNIDGNDLTIEQAFGDFANSVITGEISGVTANVEVANVYSVGSEGTLFEVVSDTEIRIDISNTEKFTSGKKILGTTSRVLATVNTATYEGTELLYSNTVVEANVISSMTKDISYRGILIGQNAICFGLANTSNNPLVFVADSTVLVSQNNVSTTINAVSGGTGAGADIGTLTNSEEITVALQKLSGENVYGIPFSSMKMSGEGSGIGFVESITVNDGGTGYVNSSSVTFSGGGYLGQDVLFDATGTVITDPSGTITSITIDDSGEGYFSTPEVSVPTGNSANLTVNMTYYYGLETNVLSGPNTVIIDLLSYANTTIGTISDLANVTRGSGYTRSPFLYVVNSLIKSYSVQDQIIDMTRTSSVAFREGEVINSGIAKGSIKSIDGSTYKIRTLTLDGFFGVGNTVTGATSGAEGTINSVQYDNDADVAGDNADITGRIVENVGIIDNLEINNSGYGYVPDETVTITANGSTITGTAQVTSQGKEEGYWKTTTSHLNSEKKLHDNNYYQEYSYDVLSEVSLDKYKEIVLNALHISGTKLFGTVSKTSSVEITLGANSEITQSGG